MKNNIKNLKSYELIYIGLSIAVILLIFCMFISPKGLSANDGLSYFGGRGWSIIPYSFAFFIYAIFCWLASNKIRPTNKRSKAIKLLLKIMTILLIGLVVTPHTVVDPIHTFFGTTLFSMQLIVLIWLAFGINKSPFVFVLLLTMLISGLFCAYYLPLKGGFLLQAQIIYQIAFAGILVYFLKKLK